VRCWSNLDLTTYKRNFHSEAQSAAQLNSLDSESTSVTPKFDLGAPQTASSTPACSRPIPRNVTTLAGSRNEGDTDITA
jgi:hypothetical protein